MAGGFLSILQELRLFEDIFGLYKFHKRSEVNIQSLGTGSIKCLYWATFATVSPPKKSRAKDFPDLDLEARHRRSPHSALDALSSPTVKR